MGRVTADDIRKYVQGIVVPATPTTVIEQARRNGAPEEVLRELEEIPYGEWHSVDRIVHAWQQVMRYEESSE